MKWNRRVAMLTMLSIPALQATPALAKKNSTPEERAKAVRLARELELDPMTDDSADKLKWYEKVPDITVTISDLLGPMPGEDHPFFSFVLAQSVFSQGAFIIEHPKQANDKVAAQTAGMLGALNAYERFVKALPDARLPYLDDMLKRRDDGTLATYMAEAVQKGCK